VTAGEFTTWVQDPDRRKPGVRFVRMQPEVTRVRPLDERLPATELLSKIDEALR
jgi:hypothetical protein